MYIYNIYTLTTYFGIFRKIFCTYFKILTCLCFESYECSILYKTSIKINLATDEGSSQNKI